MNELKALKNTNSRYARKWAWRVKDAFALIVQEIAKNASIQASSVIRKNVFILATGGTEMTTTSDLIDICSLYYVQTNAYYFMTGKSLAAFRCYMYALSARLILEGVY